MVDVRAQEESLVQRLKLGEKDRSDDAIQKKLDDIFKKSNLEKPQTEGEMEGTHSLFITHTRVTLETILRDDVKEGYKSDLHWDDIMEQLQSSQDQTVQIGTRVH